eukprot:TRINITY_DN6537_c0_g2_i1.p1 TRINITY_DN6537_c0_g2~~TRINITY_DN6537_c0_g2_i1.p1  ORF type:complete len:188 (-),score=24.09 TRINITY_DN6537_c0_g2_i1:117-680(-)
MASPAKANSQLDCLLCCTGSFPFGVLVAGLPLFVLLFLIESPIAFLKVVRMIRILELVSLLTAPTGIIVLCRQKSGLTPRGCGTCCSCPFPAWSLLAQAFDIISGISFVAEGELVSSIFGLAGIVAGALDVAFGVTWLMALSKQDGDICCGGPVVPQQRQQVVVVGQPVTTDVPEAVDGEVQHVDKN